MNSKELDRAAEELTKRSKQIKKRLEKLGGDKSKLVISSCLMALEGFLKEEENSNFSLEDLLKITDFCLSAYAHIYAVYPTFFEELKQHGSNYVECMLRRRVDGVKETLYYLDNLINI